MANHIIALLGATPDAPSGASLGVEFFDSLAGQIVEGTGDAANLDDVSEVESLFVATALNSGVAMTDPTSEAASEILAAVNQAISALAVAGTAGYLTSVVQVQVLAEGTIAPNLASSGPAGVSGLVGTYTESSVAAQAATETIGDLVPPSVAISSIVQAVGANQPGTFQFIVSIEGTPSSLEPVTISYTTQDDTATAAEGDYTPVSGTLTWTATDTAPKTITVPVGAVSPAVADKDFLVILSDPTFAVIHQAIGVGEITSSEFATTTTLSTSTTTPTGQLSVTLTAVVTNQDAAAQRGCRPGRLLRWYDRSGPGQLGRHRYGHPDDLVRQSGHAHDHRGLRRLPGPRRHLRPEHVSRLKSGGRPGRANHRFQPDRRANLRPGPLFLDAESSLYLPVTLTVISGPAVLDNDVLTITGAGTVVVEASQAGDSFRGGDPG